MADDWISAETEGKEADFRGILAMHATLCKGIMRRQGASPYLYVDLYAGPGHLEYRGRRFLGSPLIAQDILTRAGFAYETVHFERDPEVAARLAEALWTPTSLLDCPDAESAPIYAEDFRTAFPRWLDKAGHQPDRYGLIYADPIRDEIPHGLFNQAAEQLPKVDLLSYVAATQYKRRRGVDDSRPYLLDHVKAVNKRVALIRQPLGAWQWTFILWSNWINFPEWQRRGFHRLDSERGEQIMDRLNLTKEQHKAKANAPLWDDSPPQRYEPPRPGDAPYGTYREYLKHPRFLAVRKVVFERADGLCERCKSRPPTEPHHLRYPPWGAFDVPENLLAVCHPCHCEIHGKAA